MTQPAISMQVRQLEDNTGVALFEQVGKRIYLTSAGEEFHRYAQNIIRLVDEAASAMEHYKGLQTGILRVSVATTANQFATRLLGAFVNKYPGIQIRLNVTNRERLLKELEDNEPDLVIMGEPPRQKGLQLDSQQFMENPLIVVASPQHPLAYRQNLKLSEMAAERFVVREQGSGTRSAIERFFQDHGQQLATTLELGSNEAIKHAVAADLGLGIISEHTAWLELETDTLVKLNVECFPIERFWHIVTREGKRLSPVAETFREFVLNEAPRYVNPK